MSVVAVACVRSRSYSKARMSVTVDRVVRRVTKGDSSSGVGTSTGIGSLASSTAFVIRDSCCHLLLVSFLVTVTVFVAPLFLRLW